MSLKDSSSTVDDIGAEAVKLNSSAQRFSQKILVGFESTIRHNIDSYSQTLTPL